MIHQYSGRKNREDYKWNTTKQVNISGGKGIWVEGVKNELTAIVTQMHNDLYLVLKAGRVLGFSIP